MAIIIAGERSGVGKTTVTLALLCFLSQKGYRVQSFKVGPDYIDPMFHTAITARPCRNLDPFLTSEAYVQSCFARHCQGVDYAVVEGVMGLFDGIRSPDEPNPTFPVNDYGSTAHIARLLNLPVILVIDCSRLSGSVAAIASGYANLDPRINLGGVILNRVGSDRHLTLLQEALDPLNIPILGVLRRYDQITLPDRHLGLVPSQEISHLSTIFAQLADLVADSFHWERLFPLLKTSPCPFIPLSPCPSISSTPIKIAIAQDRAFNFYYPDNLEILEHLGAKLIPWSPMEDSHLPSGVQGLYFGGGFPEVFARQLAENTRALKAVAQAIRKGIPTIAECGGLMYLCEQIIDFLQKSWSMVGILPTTAVMSPSLTLGYRQGTAINDSLMLKAGETIRGHEFHRSILEGRRQGGQEAGELETLACPLFEVRKLGQKNPVEVEGWNLKNVHGSYIHLHFGESQILAQRFLTQCLDFSD